jgi:hypothetical protein
MLISMDDRKQQQVRLRFVANKVDAATTMVIHNVNATKALQP